MTQCQGLQALKAPKPLVVDADGALVDRPIAQSVCDATGVRVRSASGRADLAADDAVREAPQTALALNVNPAVEDMIRLWPRFGGEVWLIADATAGMVQGLIDALGLLARALGTDRATGLDVARKGRVITGLFGVGGYEFVGLGRPDDAVCSTARRLTLADGDARLREAFRTAGIEFRPLPLTWRPVSLRLAHLACAKPPPPAGWLASHAAWSADRHISEPGAIWGPIGMAGNF